MKLKMQGPRNLDVDVLIVCFLLKYKDGTTLLSLIMKNSFGFGFSMIIDFRSASLFGNSGRVHSRNT